MNCRYCNKECKNDNSLRNHERVCKENPNKAEIRGYIGPWTDERRQKHSLIMKKTVRVQHVYSKEDKEKISKRSKESNKKYWTEENKRKHSIIMKGIVEKNPESYSTKNICGRVKQYKTTDSFNNETKLNGKWEVIVADWLNKQNLKWTNIIKEGFKYKWNNGEHLYFPDFYLPDLNVYLEVKGYERERDRCKWRVVNNLIILKQKEIKLIKENRDMVEWFLRLSHKQ